MNYVDKKVQAKSGGRRAAGEEKPKSRSRLIVRRAKRSDVDGLVDLSHRVYGPALAHTKRTLRAQLNNFAEGQFVAEYDGKIVGHCATFVIAEKTALKPHTLSLIHI